MYVRTSWRVPAGERPARVRHSPQPTRKRRVYEVSTKAGSGQNRNTLTVLHFSLTVLVEKICDNPKVIMLISSMRKTITLGGCSKPFSVRCSGIGLWRAHALAMINLGVGNVSRTRRQSIATCKTLSCVSG